MRALARGLLVSILLVACGASTTGAPTTTVAPSSTPPTPFGPSLGSLSPTPAPISLPTPTGAGFCVDRGYALDAASLVRVGREPWRQVAAFVAAAEPIINADAASAPSSQAAYRVRQLALVLHTLELSVRGSVENYPDDYSSQTWAHGLPGMVAKVSKANDCPP
jgi:hypothetical protein